MIQAQHFIAPAAIRSRTASLPIKKHCIPNCTESRRRDTPLSDRLQTRRQSWCFTSRRNQNPVTRGNAGCCAGSAAGTPWSIKSGILSYAISYRPSPMPATLVANDSFLSNAPTPASPSQGKLDYNAMHMWHLRVNAELGKTMRLSRGRSRFRRH